MMRGILLFLVLHFGCDVLGLLPLGEVLSNDGTRMGEEVRWFFFFVGWRPKPLNIGTRSKREKRDNNYGPCNFCPKKK
jgi:hypothetical protein